MRRTDGNKKPGSRPGSLQSKSSQHSTSLRRCANNARIAYLLAVYRWHLLDLPRVVAGIINELMREAREARS